MFGQICWLKANVFRANKGQEIEGSELWFLVSEFWILRGKVNDSMSQNDLISSHSGACKLVSHEWEPLVRREARTWAAIKRLRVVNLADSRKKKMQDWRTFFFLFGFFLLFSFRFSFSLFFFLFRFFVIFFSRFFRFFLFFLNSFFFSSFKRLVCCIFPLFNRAKSHEGENLLSTRLGGVAALIRIRTCIFFSGFFELVLFFSFFLFFYWKEF